MLVDGPRCWERLTPLLDAAGTVWVASDLPSGMRVTRGVGLAEDAAAVDAALSALPGDDLAIVRRQDSGRPFAPVVETVEHRVLDDVAVRLARG